MINLNAKNPSLTGVSTGCSNPSADVARLKLRQLLILGTTTINGGNAK
jgi:hypothetical protein